MEPTTYRITRADLVAYAEASGDHNPIHQDEAVARSVGLPGVIAHGMYTLALAARYVDEQLGEPGRIVRIGAKFTRPVVVPADGTEVELWAWIAAYDHVALCQLWGAMPALPRPLPRFTRELRQRWEDVGRPPLPQAPSDAHDALADARHNLARWRVIEAARARSGGLVHRG